MEQLQPVDVSDIWIHLVGKSQKGSITPILNKRIIYQTFLIFWNCNKYHTHIHIFWIAQLNGEWLVWFQGKNSSFVLSDIQAKVFQSFSTSPLYGTKGHAKKSIVFPCLMLFFFFGGGANWQFEETFVTVELRIWSKISIKRPLGRDMTCNQGPLEMGSQLIRWNGFMVSSGYVYVLC